jgi:hypothetical protein
MDTTAGAGEDGRRIDTPQGPRPHRTRTRARTCTCTCTRTRTRTCARARARISTSTSTRRPATAPARPAPPAARAAAATAAAGQMRAVNSERLPDPELAGLTAWLGVGCPAGLARRHCNPVPSPSLAHGGTVTRAPHTARDTRAVGLMAGGRPGPPSPLRGIPSRCADGAAHRRRRQINLKLGRPGARASRGRGRSHGHSRCAGHGGGGPGSVYRAAYKLLR